MAKKIYAKAPDVVPDIVDYITPGKLYEVLRMNDTGAGFEWVSDTGDIEFAIWENSHHLDGGNWKCIEIDEDASAMSATRQTAIAALEGALPASIPAHDSDPVAIPAHIVHDALELLRGE